MSVDTRAYLNKDITPELILEVIKDKFDSKATINVKEEEYRTFVENRALGQISFNYEGYNRVILVCYSKEKEEDTIYDGTIEYLSLTMGKWKNSDIIMKEIVTVFSGYIDYDDCDDIGAEYINGDNQSEKYRKIAEYNKKEMFLRDIEHIYKKYGIMLKSDSPLRIEKYDSMLLDKIFK